MVDYWYNGNEYYTEDEIVDAVEFLKIPKDTVFYPCKIREVVKIDFENLFIEAVYDKLGEDVNFKQDHYQQIERIQTLIDELAKDFKAIEPDMKGKIMTAADFLDEE